MLGELYYYCGLAGWECYEQFIKALGVQLRQATISKPQ